MATFTFDGTSSVTASKTDTVFISADPTTFTQATGNGSSVTLAFGSQTLTITGTTLAAGNLPNVYVTGGQFSYAGTNSNVGNIDTSVTTGSVLSFLVPTSGTYTVPTDSTNAATSTASSKIAIFGGLGRTDNIDSTETIVIGGKGSTLVYADAGADTINQLSGAGGAFDSTSTVNVYGDGGADSITLANTANSKASIFVSAGTEADFVSVVNSGSTTIFGGLDSTDGNDTITLNASGTSTTALGSVANIYGNGGADSITVSNLDSTSTANVFGGFGNDSINIGGNKSAIMVIGGEGADTIFVNNVGSGGSVFITGGNPTGGDQSLDGADSITVVSARNEAYVFGNVGADTINLTGKPDDANINVYGGKDNDLINIANSTAIDANNRTVIGYEESNIFVAGGEGSDTINIGPAAVGRTSLVADTASVVTVYGGTSASDSADGADSISIAGGATGTINVFANGGNDTVTIGSLGNDSAHTATIYGGGGTDSIVVGVQNTGTTTSTNTTAVNPVNEQLVIYTNEGADTISIAHSGTYTTNITSASAGVNTVTGNSTGQTVTVADFTIGGTSADQLKITGASNSTLQVVAPPGGSFQTIQQALDAAANATTGGTGTGGSGKAAAVVFGGNTYIVVSGDNNGTYTATTDQAIKLTGVTDLVGLVGQTTITA